jgi:enolase
VIIKPNQVGSVSEAMESVALAKSYNWKTIVSHRSGETMDDFISDFAVGVQSDYIKIGAPFAKERFVKYKRLIKIEESLN